MEVRDRRRLVAILAADTLSRRFESRPVVVNDSKMLKLWIVSEMIPEGTLTAVGANRSAFVTTQSAHFRFTSLPPNMGPRERRTPRTPSVRTNPCALF